MDKLTDYQLDYAFYKKLGFCTKCRKERAEPGKTLCFECAEKHKIICKRMLDKMTPEKREELKRKDRERKRRYYVERKENRICTGCGKRESVQGKNLCIYCSIKRKKYNNDIPRNERPAYGLCYICGQLVCKDNKNLCREHYERYSENMKRLAQNPTPAMMRYRQHIKYVKHARFLNEGKTGNERENH